MPADKHVMLVHLGQKHLSWRCIHELLHNTLRPLTVVFRGP